MSFIKFEESRTLQQSPAARHTILQIQPFEEHIISLLAHIEICVIPVSFYFSKSISKQDASHLLHKSYACRDADVVF